MEDIFEIKVDHDIWRIAGQFSKISERLAEVCETTSYLNTKISGQANVYEGRGKKDLILYFEAYAQNVSKLAQYYGYCTMYIMDTLQQMIELDTKLQKAIEAGVQDYYEKNADKLNEMTIGE